MPERQSPINPAPDTPFDAPDFLSSLTAKVGYAEPPDLGGQLGALLTDPAVPSPFDDPDD